jgi:7-carboxy-7-deazaguanine synthase
MTRPTRYKVNEQFDSVQGEGLLVGTMSTFIRLQGCSVGCPWCDSGPLADEIEGKRRTNGLTANTWGAGGEWKTIEEISSGIHHGHVIITGGEPTIWNLDPIIEAAKQLNCTVQLETSGQNALKGNKIPDWVTWSPKANLGYQAPMSIKNMAREVKFVVDEYLPYSAVQKIADYYRYENQGLMRAFVMMPEGSPPSKESIQMTLDMMNSPHITYHGFPVRMGARLQYYINMR